MSAIANRELGVHGKALRKVAANIEDQLGPCLLVLRCYELLGDRPTEAQKMAETLVVNELKKLSAVLGRMPGSIAVAEQFLRTIYVLCVAKRLPEAQLTAQRFIASFRGAATNGSLKSGVAFRVGAVAAILDCADAAILDVLDAKVFPRRLAEACISNNTVRLEEVFAELEEAVLDQESRESLHQWDDTWHYILLHRIRNRLEKSCRGTKT